MQNNSWPQEILATQKFKGRKDLREFASTQAQGVRWAEFGVWSGRSARHLLKLLKPHGELHLFDSWQGLTSDWVVSKDLTHKAGTFACGVPEFGDKRVVIHKGLFSETVNDPIGPVFFYHLDCDLYESAMDVLEGKISDTARPGTLILFDDLLCYPNWAGPQGVWRAFREWSERHGVYGRWLAHTEKGQALWRTHGTG